jgi:uncharacterized membrane protein YgcG
MSQFNDYDDYNDDVDFDTNPAQSNGRDAWFRATKGQVDRVSFVYFHRYDVNAVMRARKENPKLTPADIQEIAKKAIAGRAEELSKAVDALTENDLLDRRTVKFKKFRAHFQEGLGYVISRLGLDGQEADKVWKQLPEPKIYYTTAMLFYPIVDKKGTVTRDKEQFQNGWAVRPWRLSIRNYEEFDKINTSLQVNNVSLAGQDFVMECTDAGFQNFKPTAAGPAIWSRSDSFADQVLTRAREWYEAAKLLPFREMTTKQLQEKLGGGGGSSGGGGGGSIGSGGGGGGALTAGGAGDTNFDDILNGV